MPARNGFKAPASGIVFLAVPDAAIAATAERIASSDAPAALSFVHLSGATPLDALAPLRPRAIGSFHPMQSFPFPRPPEAFRGITVAVDASTPALRRRLNALARRLGARPKAVGDVQRAAYHAAGAYASNFVTVMLREAVLLPMPLATVTLTVYWPTAVKSGAKVAPCVAPWKFAGCTLHE